MRLAAAIIVPLTWFTHPPSGVRPTASRSRTTSRSISSCLNEHRAGNPISPLIDGSSRVLLRYFYDGGTLKQGRLCQLDPAGAAAATGSELIGALIEDGVDMTRFFAAVYETQASTGAWLPVLRHITNQGMLSSASDDVRLPLSTIASDGTSVARRIDVKLFPRAVAGFDAARSAQAALPSGKLPRSGYFGIGVVGAKNQANLGTLWRSAFQLGARFLFTVGTRYRSQPTDTIHAISRVPLFQLEDWTAFAEHFAPHGAKWVAVEFGGEPLSEFEHPLDAVYLLGSEDAGLPTSVRRACHHVVSIECENCAPASDLIRRKRTRRYPVRAVRRDRRVPRTETRR